MSLPLVTLITVWPDSGEPEPASAYGKGRNSNTELRYVPGRACGSPSSRLPRNPMCPLDKANSDSVGARVPRSSAVSRSRHGSTGNAVCSIISSSRLAPEQLADILYDDIRTVFAQRFSLPDAVHADDEPEAAGSAGCNAGQGIFEYR